MRVLVLHHEVHAGDSIADADVLLQRDCVAAALKRLGHDVRSLACSLNLQSLRTQLATLRPDVVFNLVELLGGCDRLMTLVPELLDALVIRYTGCPPQAMWIANDKLTCKQLLANAGIATPSWLDGDETFEPGSRYIVKPIAEHASRGIDDSSIIAPATIDELRELIAMRDEQVGVSHFAEQFIVGREIHVSLIEDSTGEPHVLPPAEIDFLDWPADRPKIMGHAAKWLEDSTEYCTTVRKFVSASNEPALVERVAIVARQCWQVLGLRGYARVDFRVDAQGRPWVLEVNANPCIEVNASFAGALEEQGWTFDDGIERILLAAARHVSCVGA